MRIKRSPHSGCTCGGGSTNSAVDVSDVTPEINYKYSREGINVVQFFQVFFVPMPGFLLESTLEAATLCNPRGLDFLETINRKWNQHDYSVVLVCGKPWNHPIPQCTRSE